MRALLQLLAQNRATPNSFKIVKGADPDRDGDQDPPGALDSDEATVFVYGAIGDWYDEADAQTFVRAIAGLNVSTIRLRLNSPGGDVFQARAMKTALEQSKARVIAHVDGLAASAASFLMLAADEIEIAPGAFVMVHNPWSLAIGDAADMRQTADLLDQIAGVIAADYRRKTGMEMSDLRAMMDAETWLEAEAAVEKGFCDRLMEKPTKAKAQARAFNLSAFKNAPQAFADAKASIEAAAREAEEQRAAQEAAFAQLAIEREKIETRLRLL